MLDVLSKMRQRNPQSGGILPQVRRDYFRHGEPRGPGNADSRTADPRTADSCTADPCTADPCTADSCTADSGTAVPRTARKFRCGDGGQA